MYQYLKVSEQDRVVSLVISRPERRNGLGTSIGYELNVVLKKIKSETDTYLSREDSDQTPRLLILRATTVNNIWIAGGDLKELQGLDAIGVRTYTEVWTENCRLLRQIAIPSIALVDGACIGGGVELALSADFRLITSRTSFDFKQLAIGLTLGYGTSNLMLRHLGEARAKSFILGAKRIDAHKIIELGLAENLFIESEPDAELQEFCRHLQSISPYAFSSQKRMFMGLDAETETRQFQSTWGNTDHRIFLEKFRDGK